MKKKNVKKIKILGLKGIDEDAKELIKKRVFYNYFISKEIPFLHIYKDRVLKIIFDGSKLGYSEDGAEIVNLIFKVKEEKMQD